MHVITKLEDLAVVRQAANVALVPTMGNLHAGHLQLVKLAKQHASQVAVSIFVNPTQFGAGEDFDSYPRTLEADIEQLKKVGVDWVFTPSVADMYPSLPVHTQVLTGAVAQQLCGASRPGHFDGVGLVICKLFNLILPKVAVFGQKDYQQLAIIKQLVHDLNYPIQIIGADIVRAADGLALSSRNHYLNKNQRALASQLYAGLLSLREQVLKNPDDIQALCKQLNTELETLGFDVDYLELKALDLKPVTALDEPMVALAAVRLGPVRLIDNVVIAPT